MAASDLEHKRASVQKQLADIESLIAARDARVPIPKRKLDLLVQYIRDCKQYDRDYQAYQVAASAIASSASLKNELTSLKRRRTMRNKELLAITDRSSRQYRRALLDVEEYDEQIADTQARYDEAKRVEEEAASTLIPPVFPTYLKATYTDTCSCTSSCDCIPYSWWQIGVLVETLSSIHRLPMIDDILASLVNPSDSIFLKWTWLNSDKLQIHLHKVILHIQW